MLRIVKCDVNTKNLSIYWPQVGVVKVRTWLDLLLDTLIWQLRTEPAWVRLSKQAPFDQSASPDQAVCQNLITEKGDRIRQPPDPVPSRFPTWAPKHLRSTDIGLLCPSAIILIVWRAVDSNRVIDFYCCRRLSWTLIHPPTIYRCAHGVTRARTWVFFGTSQRLMTRLSINIPSEPWNFQAPEDKCHDLRQCSHFREVQEEEESIHPSYVDSYLP